MSADWPLSCLQPHPGLSSVCWSASCQAAPWQHCCPMHSTVPPTSSGSLGPIGKPAAPRMSPADVAWTPRDQIGESCQQGQMLGDCFLYCPCSNLTGLLQDLALWVSAWPLPQKDLPPTKSRESSLSEESSPQKHPLDSSFRICSTSPPRAQMS